MSTFSDGELPEPQAEQVRSHLAECDGCGDFLLFCWWADEMGRRYLRLVPAA